MAGYLEGYGAGEERRETLLKRVALIVVVILVAGGTLFLVFRNYSEKQTVKQYLTLLRAGNYQAAYTMWHADPREYPFQKFMEDWGPKSSHASASSLHIENVEACGSGVVFGLTYPGQEPISLWVERANNAISFSPWPQCPGRHWHMLAFVKSLFGKKNQ